MLCNDGTNIVNTLWWLTAICMFIYNRPYMLLDAANVWSWQDVVRWPTVQIRFSSIVHFHAYWKCSTLKAVLVAHVLNKKNTSIHLQNYTSVFLQDCVFNRLTPNNPYMGRTTPLTPKRCILYIYSTNIGTEYFKHALYSPFFSLQNAVCFIMLTCLVPVLFTFYIQGVLKLKTNPGAKALSAGFILRTIFYGEWLW